MARVTQVRVVVDESYALAHNRIVNTGREVRLSGFEGSIGPQGSTWSSFGVTGVDSGEILNSSWGTRVDRIDLRTELLRHWPAPSDALPPLADRVGRTSVDDGPPVNRMVARTGLALCLRDDVFLPRVEWRMSRWVYKRGTAEISFDLPPGGSPDRRWLDAEATIAPTDDWRELDRAEAIHGHVLVEPSAARDLLKILFMGVHGADGTAVDRPSARLVDDPMPGAGWLWRPWDAYGGQLVPSDRASAWIVPWSGVPEPSWSNLTLSSKRLGPDDITSLLHDVDWVMTSVWPSDLKSLRSRAPTTVFVNLRATRSRAIRRVGLRVSSEWLLSRTRAVSQALRWAKVNSSLIGEQWLLLESVA